MKNKILSIVILSGLSLSMCFAKIIKHTTNATEIERWGVFEVTVKGKTAGNPFTDYVISGVFSSEKETKKADGFYDGDGVYKVRFMPSHEGKYSYEISGSCIDGVAQGSFQCVAAKPGNHGPVRVANTFHFAYEDGTPCYPFGTTCYAWTHQQPELQKTTLETLKNSPFTKIRFCVFPKNYPFNQNDPHTYPYINTRSEGPAKSNEGWDFTRFNPKHFQLFEQRIIDLMALGIEADLIVMHPYDCWGFSRMSKDEDDLYWNYVVNRFSAFRNVWWSLANEFDLMDWKTLDDWERYAEIICRQDPYGHLRSIHNGHYFYDHTKPWVTHCSVQSGDVGQVGKWREKYNKPVVGDEILYEGNIEYPFGNISGQELVRKYWYSICLGGYPQHGETYVHPQDILWWSKGGELYGESPARIAFLRRIVEEAPGRGFNTERRWWDNIAIPVDAEAGSYYLIYLDITRPTIRHFHFDDDTLYKVEIIDTWNMTIEDAGVHKGEIAVKLPGREYMAVRLTKQWP